MCICLLSIFVLLRRFERAAYVAQGRTCILIMWSFVVFGDRRVAHSSHLCTVTYAMYGTTYILPRAMVELFGIISHSVTQPACESAKQKDEMRDIVISGKDVCVKGKGKRCKRVG